MRLQTLVLFGSSLWLATACGSESSCEEFGDCVEIQDKDPLKPQPDAGATVDGAGGATDSAPTPTGNEGGDGSGDEDDEVDNGEPRDSSTPNNSEDDDDAQVVPRACEPNALSCEGNSPTQCNAAGTAYVVKSACSATETCVQGVCAAQLCAPNTTFCAGKELRSCASDGLGSDLLQTCDAEQFCNANAPAGCSALSNCAPGQYVSAAPTDVSDRQCAACDGGYSTTVNAESCTTWSHCEPGTFVSTAGSPTTDRMCTECASGTASAVADQDACLPCSPGHVSVAAGATACVQASIATGTQHTCAVLPEGNLRCWGNNIDGRLGYAHTRSIGDNETPAEGGDVSVGAEVIQVAAAEAHTCALLSGGTVRCWGAIGTSHVFAREKVRQVRQLRRQAGAASLMRHRRCLCGAWRAGRLISGHRAHVVRGRESAHELGVRRSAASLWGLLAPRFQPRSEGRRVAAYCTRGACSRLIACHFVE